MNKTGFKDDADQPLIINETGFKEGEGQTLLKLINKMERLNTLARILGYVGVACLLVLVGLSTIDVVLRYFFNSPIQGTIEIIELTMVVLVFLSVAYTQATKSHVTVEILSGLLKPRGKLVLDSIACFNSIVVLLLVIWRSAVFAFETPELTLSLGIPVTPFAALVPLGCILMLLLFIRDYLEILTESVQVGLKLSVTVLPILVSIFIGAAITLMTSLDLDLPILGAIGLVAMMVLLLIGMPVGFGLMAVGFLFMSSIRGLDAGFEILGHTWFETVANYPWAAAASFFVMGFICLHSRFGEDLFHAAYKWFGHMRGGLCISSVGAIAGFSAVSGDTLTGSVTMTSIALPEMRKHKYDDVLSIGTLTCSGTLGTLIPPSLGFIIYAILAEESIGDLFIAGIIPGIITAIAFMSLVYFKCLINPKLGPRAEKSTWKERFSSLRATGPILAIFAFVIFGIFGGLFTPTEGGALGSSCAIIISVIMKRLDWKALMKSANEVARLCGMIFTILGGAKMFGYFIALSRLPNVAAEHISMLNVPPLIILFFIVMVLFILGCFMPAIPLILICVPIFLPIAHSLQWDLLWFGVIVVLAYDLATITPPFGINLFIMKGVTQAPLSVIYRGVLPFIGTLLFIVLLISIFPALATWLPYSLQ